jgi:hypothetical protein
MVNKLPIKKRRRYRGGEGDDMGQEYGGQQLLKPNMGEDDMQTLGP